MTDLLKELDAVALLAEKATPGVFIVDAYGDVQANGEDVARTASSGDLADHDARVVAAAVNFIRAHHAEIAEALRNARRYRWLRALPGKNAERAMCPNADDGVVMYQGRMLDERIDARLHDSAREVGE